MGPPFLRDSLLSIIEENPTDTLSQETDIGQINLLPGIHPYI